MKQIKLSKWEQISIIKGEVGEIDGITTINLRIINLKNGIEYANYELSRRGNERYLKICIELADKVENEIPIFGKIFDKIGSDVHINLGRMHDVKNNDILYIVSDFNSVEKLLSGPKILTKELIDKYKIGEIKIDVVDEKMSKGTIIFKPLMDSININNYVLNKKHLIK